jgi:hypothetical protein
VTAFELCGIGIREATPLVSGIAQRRPSAISVEISCWFSAPFLAVVTLPERGEALKDMVTGTPSTCVFLQEPRA